jgi:hypothetical protein
MAALRLALLASLAALLALGPSAWAAETEKAPDDDAKAAEVFQSLYGEDLKRVAATRDTADDVALAARLLEAAKAAETQPALLALLCEKAADLGLADPRGFDTALAAAGLLAAKAPEMADAAMDKVVAVRRRQYDLSRGADRAPAGEKLCEAMGDAAAAQAEAGDWDEAVKRYRQALALAHAIRSDKTATLEARLKTATQRQQSAAKAAQLEARVKADPADRQARDQLIRLVLVDLDDPAGAAEYLDTACDPALRKYVPAAAKGVEAAPELACVELGDWYRDLATAAAATGNKVSTLTRAQAYYERYLALHAAADMDRTKAELALTKVEEELERLRGRETGRWIDLLKLIDPEKDAVKGQWQRTAAGLTVAPGNEARLAIPLSTSGTYELEYKAVRVSGLQAGHTMLPVASTSVLLVINGWEGARSGLCNIDGKEPDKNGTAVPAANLKIGQPFTVKVKVALEGDQASISVALDGKPYIAWKGPQSALALHPDWAMPNRKCFGFGAWQSQLIFQSARVRMLSGEAVPLRAAETPPAAAAPAPSTKP